MKFGNDTKFPTHAIDQAQALARHEIGHWVVSRQLGFIPRDVTARIKLTGGVSREGAAEIHLSENFESADVVILYLE